MKFKSMAKRILKKGREKKGRRVNLEGVFNELVAGAGFEPTTFRL